MSFLSLLPVYKIETQPFKACSHVEIPLIKFNPLGSYVNLILAHLGCIVCLVREALEVRPALSDDVEHLLIWNHLFAVPLVAIKGHVLNESDIQPLKIFKY